MVLSTSGPGSGNTERARALGAVLREGEKQRKHVRGSFEEAVLLDPSAGPSMEEDNDPLRPNRPDKVSAEKLERSFKAS